MGGWSGGGMARYTWVVVTELTGVDDVEEVDRGRLRAWSCTVDRGRERK